MTAAQSLPPPATRLRLVIRGTVQGVGFRPFVYRLAEELGLAGWVNNSPQGVFMEAEGPRAALDQFLLRLERDQPPRSRIQSLESSWLHSVGYENFEIRESETGGDKTTLVLPDIATCPDCLREIFDPTNRRYRYPFTNCTNCGPRFSIIEALPYDRANTSMRAFTMCPACQAEYEDPHDRRFHAQPNACPVCGPQLEFWRNGVRQNAGNLLAEERWPRSPERSYEPLLSAADAIRRGQIVAIKGLGGFHLMVDARNERAVRRLREQKHREEKPLALMFPSLETVKAICDVSLLEEQRLCSPEAPIVLLRRLARPHPGPLPQERENGSPLSVDPEAVDCSRNYRRNAKADCYSFSPGERAGVRASVEQALLQIAPSVAPSNPNLGVMLPSNPLHHLLMAELGFPVIATSGNLSDEPICTDEFEAMERLRDIADVFLVNNRPIVRPLDDSIVRVLLDREMVLRRARGYAPLPVVVGTCSIASRTSRENGDPGERAPIVLAVGAHSKNSVALSIGDQVFISQHIGDLETEQANKAFRRVAADLPRLYDAQPEVIAADLHPDYLSTRFALERQTLPRREFVEMNAESAERPPGAPRVVRVQHHVAHVLSCIAENQVELPALGVAWDGTGYGPDGTIWGGEFFLVTNDEVKRVAHLRPFRLPGGDAAAKEPRRAALGLLYEMLGDALFARRDLPAVAAFTVAEIPLMQTMLKRGLNAPFSSSLGRLFDAVASLTGLRQRMRFEGQAAMELEFAINGKNTDERYDMPPITGHPALVLDWSPMVAAIGDDLRQSVPIGEISAKFHNALAEAIVLVTRRIECPRVVLSGGCFQNRYLTERTVSRLCEVSFQPHWHQRVPTNDGGISLGQVVAARREFARRSTALTPLPQPKDGPLSVPDDSPLITLEQAEAHVPSPPSTHHTSR